MYASKHRMAFSQKVENHLIEKQKKKKKRNAGKSPLVIVMVSVIALHLKFSVEILPEEQQRKTEKISPQKL